MQWIYWVTKLVPSERLLLSTFFMFMPTLLKTESTLTFFFFLEIVSNPVMKFKVTGEKTGRYKIY